MILTKNPRRLFLYDTPKVHRESRLRRTVFTSHRTVKLYRLHRNRRNTLIVTARPIDSGRRVSLTARAVERSLIQSIPTARQWNCLIVGLYPNEVGPDTFLFQSSRLLNSYHSFTLINLVITFYQTCWDPTSTRETFAHEKVGRIRASVNFDVVLETIY